ncbi:MAG: SCO family protein [Burkholderiales bacterium]
MNRTRIHAVLIAGALAAGAPAAARAHGESHQHDAAAAGEHPHHLATAAPAASAARVVLRGNPLLDASGTRVRLAKEVIGERIAVVNFIYTSCTTVCPVTSATFQQLQGRLGTALGKEVVLVSISVDPLRDTPERLHEYAGRYQARAGWTWLTGAKPDVDSVLKGFGAYTASFEDHPAMVLVGDASGWTRFLGFPSVEQLLARVETLRAARAGTGAVAHHGAHHGH